MQFGVVLKSTDERYPDDERRVPVAAENIAEAAVKAMSFARGGRCWRVHQITDLERD